MQSETAYFWPKKISFKVHDPFDKSRAYLQSLSSGLIGDDSVNCDQEMKMLEEEFN